MAKEPSRQDRQNDERPPERKDSGNFGDRTNVREPGRPDPQTTTDWNKPPRPKED